MIDVKSNSRNRAGYAGLLSERDETWRNLNHNLIPRLKDRGFRGYLEAADAILDGYRDRYMPLDVLSARIRGVTGYQLHAAQSPQDFEARAFFALMRRRSLVVNPRLRDRNEIAFTPEPDYFHDAVGHGVSLACPSVARLYDAFALAAERAGRPDSMIRIRRLFWFVCEVGVIREPSSKIRAFGAAILTSTSELDGLEQARILPFDPETVEATDYVYSQVQPQYFAADSVESLIGATIYRLEEVDS